MSDNAPHICLNCAKYYYRKWLYSDSSKTWTICLSSGCHMSEDDQCDDWEPIPDSGED